MRQIDELMDLFRQRGLKVTPQRQRIFLALVETSRHPSAESIYTEVREEMPTISLKTVYETLNCLVEMGEIQQFDLGMGARRFDPNAEVHHHLVCDACGNVQDFRADHHVLSDLVRTQYRFTVTSASITFGGLCESCSG